MDDSVEDGIAFFGALDQTESLAENRSAGTGIGGLAKQFGSKGDMRVR